MQTRYFTDEKICRAAHALQAERSDMEFILFMEMVLPGVEVTRGPLRDLLTVLTLVREAYQQGAADALFRLAECEAELRGNAEKKAYSSGEARWNLGGTKEKHGKPHRNGIQQGRPRNEARGNREKMSNVPREEVERKTRGTREEANEKGNGAW